MKKYSYLVVILLICLWGGGYGQAQIAMQCESAPPPRLTIGGEGRVKPGDANNLRDLPALTGTKVGMIPGGAIFTVRNGPVCADDLNWWLVNYDGLTGWTVEGQGTEYWIEPVIPVVIAPAVAFEPLLPVINHLEPGVRARVLNEFPASEPTSLRVRSEASLDGAIVMTLPAGTLLSVVDGPQEADGYFWWQIETDNGQQGWVIEGLFNEEQEQFERTLLPLCPLTENRVAFHYERYIYTANMDGSGLCILDLLLLPEVHTFYPYFAYFPNTLLWSPDRTQIAYIDYSSMGSYGMRLFLLSASGSTRELVVPGDVYWADWSPDGQRLLVSQIARGGEPQIWTMKADGSAYGALTDSAYRKVWAGWLADSDTVLYVENIGEPRSQIGRTPQEYIFYTVNVTSGGLSELFRTTLDVVDVALSPDRSKLLIRGWETIATDGYAYLEATDLQTLVLNIATGDIIFQQENLPYRMQWLPGSDGLVSVEDDSYDLFVIFLNDSKLKTIPFSQQTDLRWEAVGLGWLPDGRYSLFSTGADNYTSVDDPSDNMFVFINVTDGTVTFQPLIPDEFR